MRISDWSADVCSSDLEAFLSDIGHIWLRELEPTLSRYAVVTIGVWLLLWVALRPLLTARKIREDRPPARQMLVELMFSLRSMVIFATGGVALTFQIGSGPCRGRRWQYG